MSTEAPIRLGNLDQMVALPRRGKSMHGLATFLALCGSGSLGEPLQIRRDEMWDPPAPIDQSPYKAPGAPGKMEPSPRRVRARRAANKVAKASRKRNRR